MAEQTFDLVVLGGGPGGYVAAIRAAQLGLKTACIDENAALGGTCLRVGCIPSKALLESSHLYSETQSHFADHGIELGEAKFDLGKMMSRKDSIVKGLTDGIEMLLKRNKITVFRGRGQLKSAHELVVNVDGKEQEIATEKIIIATGSNPAMLPGVEFDGDLIGDSTTALSYSEPPKELVVIGAGYIGLELGSVWRRLGSKVTVLEALDRIMPGMDGEIAKLAQRSLEKQGLEFRLGVFVESVKVENGKPVVRCKDGTTLTPDRVLMATGRVPNTKNIGLEAIGLETDRRGTISVNSNFETAVPGVYAIGDCIGGAMLAHKASEEGIACVEKMVTGAGVMHYNAIPGICYTHPEVATVGKSEEQLKEEGIAYRKGMCPYGANGRARALGDTEGRVKILACEKTDRILGVHAIGNRAGDLISEAAVAITFGATSEDLARCCHAHPTLSEIVHEAALAVDKRAIHT